MRFIFVLIALFVSTTAMAWSLSDGGWQGKSAVTSAYIITTPSGQSFLMVMDGNAGQTCPFSSLHPQIDRSMKSPVQKKNYHSKEFHEKFRKFHKDVRPTPEQSPMKATPLPVAV
ncbi:hypothetical protein SAMN02745165_00521 [Malonomonas rubra DSM 5091]|uniref:Uncharacterized protein n=1 Tax=Malonomonas rubra DSM 5091 TaxID=1122189 RepID=A0A1M6CGF9_MALRU|nr:hypothetical protein [Malonomonas rubra]SHI60102.1 hypothetical protein SAMN02745165_00521 [Malonomonas rubra DSM 5091]